MSKSVTFYINHEAYTIEIGDDHDNAISEGIQKFLSTDNNHSTKDLLLAYIRKTEELINFQREVQRSIYALPTLDKLKDNFEE